MVSNNMKLNFFLGLVAIMVQEYAGMIVRKRSCFPGFTFCRSTPGIENGAYTSLRFNRVGSVATLTCNDGFVQALGNSQITCQSNGNWEESTAECVKPGSLYVTVFPKITENSENINGRLLALAPIEPAEVTIMSEFESTNRSVSITESVDEDFPVEFTLEETNTTTNRVLVIRADESMTVHTILFRRRGGNIGYMGFLVRPVEQLTEEYLLLVPTFNSQFNIIAVEDDTTVTIDLFGNGENIDNAIINLDKFQVFTFIANESVVDFSGTSITSNNKISVIASSAFTRIPNNTDNSNDGTAVQLIGVSQWSDECILTPFLDVDIPFEYKILASEDDTNITITDNNGSTTMSLNKQEVFTGQVLTDDAIVIEATRNILVGQFSFSRMQGGFNFRDPSMVLCQPPSAYQNSYVFRVPDINVATHIVRVTIESENANDVTLNGSPVFLNQTLSVIGPGDTNYTIIYINVDEEVTNTITTTSGVSFGADYYGTGRLRQLAYSLGWGYF